MYRTTIQLGTDGKVYVSRERRYGPGAPYQTADWAVLGSDVAERMLQCSRLVPTPLWYGCGWHLQSNEMS